MLWMFIEGSCTKSLNCYSFVGEILSENEKDEYEDKKDSDYEVYIHTNIINSPSLIIT